MPEASPMSPRQLELGCTCKDFQAGRMCRHLWASIVHLDCTEIDDFGDAFSPELKADAERIMAKT